MTKFLNPHKPFKVAKSDGKGFHNFQAAKIRRNQRKTLQIFVTSYQVSKYKAVERIDLKSIIMTFIDPMKISSSDYHIRAIELQCLLSFLLLDRKIVIYSRFNQTESKYLIILEHLDPS